MGGESLATSKLKKSQADVPVGRWFLAQVFLLLRQYLGQAIWAAVLVVLFYFCSDTLKAFAGKVSVANFLLSVAAHLDWAIKASVGVSGVTTVAWLNEYRRHKRTRERLSSRITALEKRLDPNRTSSELTPEGTTRTEDL